MKSTPYLYFDGNAKEAFAYYVQHLGGKILFSMTYGEMPPEPAGSPSAESGCTPDDKARDRLAHIRMQLGEGILMAGDCPPGRYAKPEGFSLSLDARDKAHAQRLFEVLSAQGEVFMPLGETSWAHAFAMVRDRFGVPWMINLEKESF